MPVMRHLNVGGTTYDTVGEASVTQVQSSGTKIATVSIDGTSTDIYAPSGGSSVEPATAAPIVDGTAAVGTSAKYAREDHVHPTDTSRQAALVSGTNIKTVNNESLLGSGDIAIDVPTASTTNPSMDGTASYGSGTSYARSNHVHPTDTSRQATLVSGTNIKTINSTSLLGSGNIAIAGLPNVSASDNGKVLRVVNGAWAAASLPSASGVSF